MSQYKVRYEDETPYGTGFIAGAFDLGPHAGHMATIRQARLRCKHLIVGLHTDPSLDRASKNKPLEPVHQRAFKLMACQYVDGIIPYERESDLLELLALLQPEVRFLGSDYIDKDFTGKELCQKMGTKIIYIPRYHEISSSGLRKKLSDEKPASGQVPDCPPHLLYDNEADRAQNY